MRSELAYWCTIADTISSTCCWRGAERHDASTPYWGSEDQSEQDDFNVCRFVRMVVLSKIPEGLITGVYSTNVSPCQVRLSP